MAEGFQFFREQAYAMVRGQGAPSTGAGKKARGERAEGKRSARDIVGEAVRAEGDHPHVRAPAPPRVLHGVPADELLTWCEQLEDLAKRQVVKTAKGERRQRSDTPIVVGAIASYPGPADDADPDYVAWRAKTKAFLLQRYGDRVVSIIEHVDEPHGHIHCLVADRGRSVKPLMAGHAAQLKAEAGGLSKKEASAAYKAAARELQDAYYAAVSIEVGLTRIGPGSRSLPRAAWQAEKAQARALAQALKRNEEERDALAAQSARNEVDRAQLKQKAAALGKQHADLEAQRRELGRMVAAMSPEQVEIAARKADDLRRAEERAAAKSTALPPAAGSIKRSVPR